jgi:hypothetical protein
MLLPRPQTKSFASRDEAEGADDADSLARSEA